jgi:hypothetical protein
LEHHRCSERRRGPWWHRSQQLLLLQEGFDFAQDTQGDNDDDFEFIPNLDEEGGMVGLNSTDGDDEVVPETEPQFLVGMDANAMVDKGLGVDVDAETDDEFITMEVKNEGNKVTSDNHAQAEDLDFSFITQNFEDFKMEWMKLFLFSE